MTNKRVASKKARQSLQQVDLASLPDTEKSMYYNFRIPFASNYLTKHAILIGCVSCSLRHLLQ